MSNPVLAPLALVLLALASGCGVAGSIRAARDASPADPDQFVRLRAMIAAEVRRGELSDGAVRDLAHAVASVAVRTAYERQVPFAAGYEFLGEGDAMPARVGGGEVLGAVRSCAAALDDALEARSEREDRIGAEAALIRIEAGLIDADEYADRLKDRGPFRAVAARGQVEREDGAARRSLLVDGDEEVRLAAARAAVDAADPADVEALLEVARLDPAPLVRTAAIRALGVLGGQRVVLGLSDRYARADEADRQAIAAAWGSPASLGAGGREALRRALGEPGTAGVAAAAFLARAGGEDRAETLGRLAAAIAGGATRERVFAIQVAPLTGPVDEALGAAEEASDPAVAVAALGKRLSATGLSAERREATQARLLELAPGSTAAAIAAKGYLGRAGVKAALPLFMREASAADTRARAAAAIGLVGIGEPRRAAPLLADRTEAVRLALACRLLRE